MIYEKLCEVINEGVVSLTSSLALLSSQSPSSFTLLLPSLELLCLPSPSFFQPFLMLHPAFLRRHFPFVVCRREDNWTTASRRSLVDRRLEGRPGPELNRGPAWIDKSRVLSSCCFLCDPPCGAMGVSFLAILKFSFEVYNKRVLNGIFKDKPSVVLNCPTSI